MKAIFENKKILFIHIPKCAGTSIEESFYKQLGENYIKETWLHIDNDKLYGNDKSFPPHLRNLNHLTCYNIFEELKIVNDLNYIFTICRNPYDRFISLANWIKEGWEKENRVWNEKEQVFLNFKDLEELANNIIYKNNKHHMFKPQYEYIEGFEKEVKIFKIEEGMDNIMKKIEMDNNFSFTFSRIHTNYNSRKIKFKIEDIDDKTKKMINDFYKKDFIFFKYNMQ
jgi:hypothetical protein